MPFNPSQLCIKCATGECQYRDGIMCRAIPCARDDPKASSMNGFGTIMDLLKKFHGVKQQ